MLNPAQLLAVQTISGPVRIIAGAGTGKTHTLINRIDFLVNEKNIPPAKILTLTFSNKAAHELKDRLRQMKIYGVAASTFHALAAGLLRKFWNKEFIILNTQERESIVKNLLNEREQSNLDEILIEMEKIDEERFCHPRSSLCHPRAHFVIPAEAGISLVTVPAPIDSRRNLPRSRVRGGNDNHDDSNNQSRLQQINESYQNYLTQNNALDFNGLLTKLLDLWQNDISILQICQSQFEYLLVDEYQDVNVLQILIMQKLAAPQNNICVVGDPDQTIYSWRGASAQTMAEFVELYPQTQTIILEENYRNPPAILRAAEMLITHNQNRLPKILKANKSETNRVKYWETQNHFELSEKLIWLLQQNLGSLSHMPETSGIDHQFLDQTRSLKDIAILYRTQHQGKNISAQLEKHGYPYQLSSPANFWALPVISRFLNELELLKTLNQIKTELCFSSFLRIKIDDIIKHHNYLGATADNLLSLIPYAVAFDHLRINEAVDLFLEETKTTQDADNLIHVDKINLLTLHSAKGLEFPVVIIIGLEEDVLPFKKLKDDPYFLEEERRLLYVGLTRATDQLHLFYTKMKKEKPCERSRFLNEIGLDNLEIGRLPAKRQQQFIKKQSKKAQMKMF